MATLYITELISLGFDPHGNPVLAPQVPGGAEQEVAIGVAAAASQPFAAGARFIMLHTDAICFLDWGTNPVATTHQRMAAGETRFYSVRPGDRVSVIVGT